MVDTSSALFARPPYRQSEIKYTIEQQVALACEGMHLVFSQSAPTSGPCTETIKTSNAPPSLPIVSCYSLARLTRSQFPTRAHHCREHLHRLSSHVTLTQARRSMSLILQQNRASSRVTKTMVAKSVAVTTVKVESTLTALISVAPYHQCLYGPRR